MSISSTVRRAGPFSGTGLVSVFPFSFAVFQPSDLYVVSLNIFSGTQTELVFNTDYTVSLNANQNYSPGGTVTLTLPLATGYSLVISSDIEELQGTELTNQGGFYPEALTSSLDLLTILIQQIKEQLDRTISIPISDPSILNQLPSAAQRAGMFLSFDANGSPQAAISALAPLWQSNTVTPFSGTPLGTQDGTNKVFTLANAGIALRSAPNQVGIFNNGLLVPPSAYTLTGVSVAFTVAPAPTDTLWSQGILLAVAPTQSAVAYGEAVSTLNQTVFTTPLYTISSNNLIVFAGGQALTNGVDYTETSTSSITLLQPSPAGMVYTFRVIA